MKEEKRTLEQLFDDYRPEMRSSVVFMKQLEKRLDAIDYVRQIQAREHKRNRLVMLCAFACGLVVGGILYAMLTIQSNTLPSITIDTHVMLLCIISENSHLFLCTMLSTLAIAGIMIGVGMCQDIVCMKNMKELRKALDS